MIWRAAIEGAGFRGATLPRGLAWSMPTQPVSPGSQVGRSHGLRLAARPDSGHQGARLVNDRRWIVDADPITVTHRQPQLFTVNAQVTEMRHRHI